MVDCGAVQGESAGKRPLPALPVNPSEVTHLLLTHAHIDHIGNLLEFIRDGFTGPIFCTEVTAKLTCISLRDSLDIRYRDAEREKSPDKSKEKVPLLTILEELPSRFIHLDAHVGVGQPYALPGIPGLTVELYPTSHVVGSVAYLIRAEAHGDLQGAEIYFSGDVGPVEDEFAHQGLSATRSRPVIMPRVVVLESTYGDRPARDPLAASGEVRRQALAKAFREELARHESPVFIIPTFSLGRTTDVLHDVVQSIQERHQEMGLLPTDIVEVVCGSRLARAYAPVVRDALLDMPRAGKVAWGNGRFRDIANRDQLAALLSPDTLPEVFIKVPDGPRIRVIWGDQPYQQNRLAIWLQSPGTTIGGRVSELIVGLAKNPQVTLVLVGYVPPGGMARQLEQIVRTPVTDRQGLLPLVHERPHKNGRLEVAADAVRMGFLDFSAHYSGHADAESLIRHIEGEPGDPDMDVILVHGTFLAREAFEQRIRYVGGNPRAGIRRVYTPSAGGPWFDVGDRRWLTGGVRARQARPRKSRVILASR